MSPGGVIEREKYQNPTMVNHRQGQLNLPTKRKIDLTSPQVYACAMSDSTSSIETRRQKIETFPTDDENIVRYLINKQTFDGLWNLDSKDVEQLIGKSLSHFQQLTSIQILISSIVVLVLETRFASFSSMWHGVVQKARKCLLQLLGNDSKNLDELLEDIRQHL